MFHLLRCPALNITDNLIDVSKIVNYDEEIDVRRAHASNLHMLITQYSCMMRQAKEHFKQVILDKNITVSFVSHEAGWIRSGIISDIWSGSHCRISSLSEPNELDVDVMAEITKGTLIVLDGCVNTWWRKHWLRSNPKLERNKICLTCDSKFTFPSNKLQMSFSFSGSEDTTSAQKNEPDSCFSSSLLSLNKQCACESSVVPGLFVLLYVRGSHYFFHIRPRSCAHLHCWWLSGHK